VVEGLFAIMTEWWMPEVVGEARGGADVGVDWVLLEKRDGMVETMRNRLRDLRNFKGMCQAVTKEVGILSGEKLRLPLKTTECGAMDETRSITPNI
jgi:hypothetical protein